MFLVHFSPFIKEKHKNACIENKHDKFSNQTPVNIHKPLDT